MSNEYNDWVIETTQVASKTVYEIYSLITYLKDFEDIKNETFNRIVTNFFCNPYFRCDTDNGEQCWTAVDWLLDTLDNFSDLSEEQSYQKYKELLEFYGWESITK